MVSVYTTQTYDIEVNVWT